MTVTGRDSGDQRVLPHRPLEAAVLAAGQLRRQQLLQFGQGHGALAQRAIVEVLQREGASLLLLVALARIEPALEASVVRRELC